MDTKPTIKNYLVVVLPAILAIFIIFFIVMPKVKDGRDEVRTNKPNTKQITNFAECIAAGNPAMESYPRQCRAGGQTFTEVLEKDIVKEITCADGSVAKDIPVCGKIQIQCFTTPCDPIEETFKNRCEARERGAFDIRDGECSQADRACVKAGEYVDHFDKNSFDCCQGLVKTSAPPLDENCKAIIPENSPGIEPGWTCINCGDGICDSEKKENKCNCPTDC